jgi:hypothetical protein
MENNYQADKVPPKETQAMGIFQLACIDAGLSKVPEDKLAFNVIEYPSLERYIVQAGRIENDKFISHGETTSISIPKGKNLQQIAQDELRLTKLKTNIFLNGELSHKFN